MSSEFDRLRARQASAELGRSLPESPHLGVHHRVEVWGEVTRIWIHVADLRWPDRTPFAMIGLSSKVRGFPVLWWLIADEF